MSLFLQVAITASDSAAHAKAATDATAKEGMNLLSLVMSGGWVMIPLGILLVLTIYFAIERFLTIRRASRIDKNFMHLIRENLMSGKVDAATSLCKNTNTPIARLLEKGLKRVGKPIKEVESAVESEGRLEIYKLEKNMNWLGIISGIAPMLGFVGTISGVIKIFYNISQEGNISIAALSGGLYEKMITSACGLIIGILAHICFHYLNSMIDRVSFQVESSAVEFIDLIQEPSN